MNPAIYKSIHAVEIGHPLHNALADAGPSVIELWDLAVADDRPEIEGWRAPLSSAVLSRLTRMST